MNLKIEKVKKSCDHESLTKFAFWSNSTIFGRTGRIQYGPIRLFKLFNFNYFFFGSRKSPTEKKRVENIRKIFTKFQKWTVLRRRSLNKYVRGNDLHLPYIFKCS